MASPAPTETIATPGPAPTPPRLAPPAATDEATDEETTTMQRDDVLASVVEALADREGVPAHRISVIEVERRTWPDGALGCPEPGGVYTQAVESGYRVLLGIDDRRFDYRVSDRGAVRRCEQPLRSRLRPEASRWEQ